MNSSRVTNVAWALVSILCPILLQGGLQIWGPQPLAITGDHAFFLSDIKQFVMGQGLWSSTVTGYPFGQNVSYFPTFEPLYRLVLWLIAQTGSDVWNIAKIFYVLGVGAMGGVAYLCLRTLSITNALSAIGAIAFALTPYFAVRALNHDMLSIYVPAAFGAAFAIRIASFDTRDQFSELLKTKTFLVGMLIIATCGLYYAMFSLLLMGVSTVSLTVRSRQLYSLALFSCISAAVVAVMIGAAMGPDISVLLAHAPKRGPVEQFWHGLSISDSILAFDWIPWIHRHVVHYGTTRWNTLVGEGFGEWPGAALTLVILASPLIVLCSRSTEKFRKITLTAALISFILIFAGRAGYGYLLNELINPSLRAQARIMPLLMFMAIFIVVGCSQIALETGRLMPRLGAVATICAMLASSWATSGVLVQRQRSTADNADTQWLMNTFIRLDQTKDSRGIKAVLQLPIAAWPETPFRNGYTFYPMRYGFLFDRRDSQTKWSYGVAEGQDGFVKLNEAFKLGFDPAGVVGRARSFGYDSILVELDPYTKDERKSVVEGIESALPPICRIFDDNHRILFDIGQSPNCK